MSINSKQPGAVGHVHSRKWVEKALCDDQAGVQMDDEGCPNVSVLRREPAEPVAASPHSTRAPHLDRALEFAVIQAWDELMPRPATGLIHIEYETGSDGSLDFFKVWASMVRGNWSLVCEFWLRPLWFHATGLSFSNDYHSSGFAEALKRVARRQDRFAKLPNRKGLIQVSPPTHEERRQARRWLSMAQRLSSNSPDMPAAA
ncbi:MAG: hypothetical protein ACLGXA_15845 [Acidobacteriota bacterium]